MAYYSRLEGRAIVRIEKCACGPEENKLAFAIADTVDVLVYAEDLLLVLLTTSFFL